MTPIISFAAVADSKIDAEAGVIRGVSLITVGPALGHGVAIDRKTLEQVKTAAELYTGGLKVKLDHSGGAGDIIGYIDTMRIEGDKLLGDLHLLQSSPHRTYILEIAQRIPDTFGLSIAFSGPSEVGSDKKTILQRCSEIYSVDLVSEPAANPDGFFSRKLKELESVMPKNEPSGTPQNNNPMNEDDKKSIGGMIESAMMAMNDRLSKLESAMAPAVEVEDEKKEVAEMKAKNDMITNAANEGALAAIREFSKQFGAPAAPVASAEAVKPADAVKRSFEQIVADKSVELKGNKSAAISFAVKNHSAEYTDYRARVQSGEIVKL
jgi:hypothetical protein